MSRRLHALLPEGLQGLLPITRVRPAHGVSLAWAAFFQTIFFISEQYEVDREVAKTVHRIPVHPSPVSVPVT